MTDKPRILTAESISPVTVVIKLPLNGFAYLRRAAPGVEY